MPTPYPPAFQRSLDAIGRFWSNRPVVMFVPEFNGEARTLVRELTAYGARIAGIVTTHRPPGNHGIPAVFACDEHGFAVAPKDFDTWMIDPPTVLSAWLESVDPDCKWTGIGCSLFQVSAVFGRPVHGWRRPHWAVWEDKTKVEEIWRSVGVPSPRHLVVDVHDPQIEIRTAALSAGGHLVMSLDAAKYYFAGGQGVRRLDGTPGDLERALEWARGRSDRVRIAEFVSGRPCSTLGIVLADGVAVFDPIELLVLLDTTSGQFEFCGLSSLWRPDPAWAENMRTHVRRIGAWLAAHAGFRGIFSVDGIAGQDGFVATELNPRQSAGLGIRRAWPDFPLNLFQRAAQEGVPEVFAMPAAHVESELRELIRRHAGFSLRCAAPAGPAAVESGVLRVDGPDQQVAVHYRQDGPDAVAQSIEPPPPAGSVIAPIAVAFAHALGRTELAVP